MDWEIEVPPLSPRRKSALISGLIFLFIAALAIHGPSPVSNIALQSKLQMAVDAALTDAELDNWASVEMDGQVAILSGLSPSFDARDTALKTVESAEWVGGLVAGGVTQIIDQTSLVDGADRFGLRAHFDNGRLRLIGYAPDARAAERIQSLAERLFSGRVETEFHLEPGGAPMGWEAAVRLLLGELARLDSGRARFDDNAMVLIGHSENPQTIDAVENAFETVPMGINAAALVSRPSQTFRQTLTDDQMCAFALNAALDADVRSPLESASLSLDWRSGLARAAQVRPQCSARTITVLLRTSSDDVTALNAVGDAILSILADGHVNQQYQIETLSGVSGQPIEFTVSSLSAVGTELGVDANSTESNR